LAGDAIITGQAGTNSMTGGFPPAPAPVVGSSGTFVLKLDPTGSKILAAISGVGGMIAMDSQSNIYVAGLQYSDQPTPIPATPGAFQSEPLANACGLLDAFSACDYQYVAKLNPALNNIVYTTYITGEYGATPAAIGVDAQGDVFVAGTTISPDYPTTPNAYEPQYIASAAPKVSCFFIINCFPGPPASGYLTEVNPTGTGLIYSSFFGGTQTDTISFFALTPNVIYLGGSAGSAISRGSPATANRVFPNHMPRA
jgi:Ca2+-binding RTX toxin-like protein